MYKCDAVTMRKNLELVETLRQAGVDFVPMPVMDKEDKQRLAKEAMERVMAALFMEVVFGASSEE
ncbi:DUF1382 family protein [Vibrio parahaemolyticus]|nr:DUF1382 family protein [Vibrio parahaemolyticus]EJN2402898.1 DUF1382 family protein [Vibrio parahaemolyticus]MBE3704356.1 DUF1382 family protein [Vibrio parahaemolyticus]MBE3769320.1 DUF1382 family protein [Vibrio parahaemolyticus]